MGGMKPFPEHLHVSLFTIYILSTINIWAASWQNQQSGMSTQQRLIAAWASAQSDQSLRCALYGKLRTQAYFMQTMKTDQTGRTVQIVVMDWL